MPIYNKNKNITFPSNILADQLYAQRYGNVVTVNGYVKINIPSGSSTTHLLVGTLNDGYKPTVIVREICAIAIAPYEVPEEIGYLTLDTNGSISIKSSLTGEKAIWFSCSYIV